MTLEDWRKNGWVLPHETSSDEIAGLLAVIDRDLKASADIHLDSDWRFAIAYNAALQAANAALKAAGFDVPKGGGAHHRTIESLALTVGATSDTIEKLQKFRAKRGGGMYETTGIAGKPEIEELMRLAKALRDQVLEWISRRHPSLLASIHKPKHPERPKSSRPPNHPR